MFVSLARDPLGWESLALHINPGKILKKHCVCTMTKLGTWVPRREAAVVRREAPPPILPACKSALLPAELLNSHRHQVPGCPLGFLSWRRVGFHLSLQVQSSLTQPYLDFPVESENREQSRPFGGSGGDSRRRHQKWGEAVSGNWRCASRKPIWGHAPPLPGEFRTPPFLFYFPNTI